MASLQNTVILSSSRYSLSLRRVNASIHVPKSPQVPYSVPKMPTRKLQINGSIDATLTPLEKDVVTTQIHDGLNNTNKSSKAIIQLYAILEAVADRVEMHNNVGEQRDNWNALLLNSINMITLTATTMSGVVASTCGGDTAPLLALKLSSTLLFSAATGLLLVMNKIQPSQLAEEQRIATRLFRQIQTEIETRIALGNPTEEDVKSSLEKVLALDKAYPLPLLGAMLEKFPAKFEPAVWWPAQRKSKTYHHHDHEGKAQSKKMEKNGWSEELEMELREVIEVVKRKDIEDYERLGNIALKINKTMAITGPLLTGIAAVGSSFVGNGSWAAAIVPVMAGSLASAVNAFQHGGQVGMVFEMYRNCGGFFTLLEETVESTLEERDLGKRENGELFEMKLAMQLGRSVSELRQLASKSASSSMEGIAVDEFASKLF